MDTGEANLQPGHSAEFINNSWRSLAGQFTADADLIETCLREIVDAYSKPKRYYHNLDHIAFMLELSNQYAQSLEYKAAVDFATFYHDIIYKVTAQDNEQQSGILAMDRLGLLRVPDNIRFRACVFIEATKDHELAEESSMDDLRYFLDFDMAILGADWDTYQTYLKSIRKEYKYYPDLLYYPGRRKFLKKTLESKCIFHTEAFRSACEAKARANIQRELDMR
jgi:predicted metal-dependent HD superfamily phosphohydrolase